MQDLFFEDSDAERDPGEREGPERQYDYLLTRNSPSDESDSSVGSDAPSPREPRSAGLGGLAYSLAAEPIALPQLAIDLGRLFALVASLRETPLAERQFNLSGVSFRRGVALGGRGRSQEELALLDDEKEEDEEKDFKEEDTDSNTRNQKGTRKKRRRSYETLKRKKECAGLPADAAKGSSTSGLQFLLLEIATVQTVVILENILRYKC